MAKFVDLEDLIGSPTIIPPTVQWGRLESELGVALPSDYKALANAYPTLNFDDFLGWFHPGIPADPVLAARKMSDALEPLRSRLRSEEWIEIIDDHSNCVDVAPYPIYPEPEGVLQWGMTENGDRCLWLMRGLPDEWTVVIERGMRWHFDGGLVDFLVGVLTRQARCPLFPDDFPSSLDVVQSLD